MATEPHTAPRPRATEVVQAMRERNAPRRAEVQRAVERMRRYAAARRSRRA